MKVDNVALLMYTSEPYLPIAKLSINEFNRYSEGHEISKYMVSNKIPNSKDFDNLDFSVLDANVNLSSDSRHFAEVLIFALEKIKEKYIILWLEDTFVSVPIKYDNLNSLIRLMDDNEINHLSLMSYGHDWKIMDLDYTKYGLPNNLLFEMPNSYVYTFSVQPAIWKTETLLDILKHNIGISLHEFDTSNVKNKLGDKRGGDRGDGYINTPEGFWDYNISHTCFKRTFETTQYCFDDRPIEGDYFLFLYSGAIRGGKFDFGTHNNTRIYIKKFLEENNITNEHPEYKNFF
jgi:hypothetical protein